MSTRRSGHSRLVYDKATRSIVEDRTPKEGHAPIEFSLEAQIEKFAAVANKVADDRNALLSIARRWVALDAGGWHPDRHAADKAQLIVDTLAAIAKAITP